MSFGEFDPGGVAEPLRWKHVYVRSAHKTGFVFRSRQNGIPAEAEIDVALIRADGQWYPPDGHLTYTMQHAREDLVPDIKCVIEEPPL